MSRVFHPASSIGAPSGTDVERYFDLTVRGLIEGQTTINTYMAKVHVKVGGGGEADPTADLLAGFKSSWVDPLLALQSDQWELVSIHAVTSPQVDAGAPLWERQLDYTGVYGAVGGGALPSLDAVLIPFKYLRSDGRIRHAPRYIPGIPESSTGGSHLIDPFLAGLGLLLPTFGNILPVAAVAPTYSAARIVVKERHPVPGGPDTFTGQPILGVYQESLLSTCRRRKVGRGI